MLSTFGVQSLLFGIVACGRVRVVQETWGRRVGETRLIVGVGWKVYVIVEAVNCWPLSETRTAAAPAIGGVRQATCIWCVSVAGTSTPSNMQR